MFFEGEQLEMIMRLMLSCFLGGIIGLERESGERPAGFRTHTLVCTGSCLFMLVSIYGFDDMGTVRDPARLAAQVVSGVGFLGAGTILHEGVNVKGLTTAASIWMISAIGLATGVGLYTLSIFATVLMLATLIVFGKWGKIMSFTKQTERYEIKISAKDEPGNMDKIMNHLNVPGVKVKSLNVVRDMCNETITLSVRLIVSSSSADEFDDILLDVKNLDYIIAVESSALIK